MIKKTLESMRPYTVHKDVVLTVLAKVCIMKTEAYLQRYEMSQDVSPCKCKTLLPANNSL